MPPRVLLALGLALIGPRAAAKDSLSIELVLRAGEVELGRGFELELRRAWESDLVPEDFDARALAPLVLVPAGRELREEHGRFEERLGFRAHLFQRGELELAPLELRAKSRTDGSVRVARSGSARLRVRSSLPPGPPGPPEPPEPLLRAPFPWPLLFAGAALCVALAALFLRARGGKAEADVVESAAPAPAPPHLRARERLAELRARRVEGAEASRAFHDESAELLREYARERFRVAAFERTSEELCSALRTRAGPALASLAEALARCDRVKYARALPPSAERERLLACATDFVECTREGGA